MDNKALSSGQQGEALALAHLERQGLRLLEKNWRCKAGELDLVMLEGDTVVFVEVRYRRHSAWGGALESIDFRKQQKLIRAAQQFLLEAPRWRQKACRFDVIALAGDEANPSIEWIPNAFDSQH